MNIKKLGIVIYGKCRHRNGFWEEWLDKAKELIYIIGHTPTHIGVTGTSFSEDLRTLNVAKEKLKQLYPVENQLNLYLCIHCPGITIHV